MAPHGDGVALHPESGGDVVGADGVAVVHADSMTCNARLDNCKARDDNAPMPTTTEPTATITLHPDTADLVADAVAMIRASSRSDQWDGWTSLIDEIRQAATEARARAARIAEATTAWTEIESILASRGIVPGAIVRVPATQRLNAGGRARYGQDARIVRAWTKITELRPGRDGKVVIKGVDYTSKLVPSASYGGHHDHLVKPEDIVLARSAEVTTDA